MALNVHLFASDRDVHCPLLFNHLFAEVNAAGMDRCLSRLQLFLTQLHSALSVARPCRANHFGTSVRAHGADLVLADVQENGVVAQCGRLLYGAAAGTALPLAWGMAGRLIEHNAPWPLQVVVLKSAFAGKSLHAAARRVENTLADGDVDRARADLRWLVSRPTSELSEDSIAAAAIESLAENLVDSWVAPLLAYALFARSATRTSPCAIASVVAGSLSGRIMPVPDQTHLVVFFDGT
jgi:CobD/CbiB protein